MTGTLSSFRHGVHPEEFKEVTEHLPLERMPFVEEYTLPLSQHIGAPSKCCITVGQKVKRGQVLAQAGGFVSVPMHAPVAGTVTRIEKRPHPNGKLMESIVLKTDPFNAQRWNGVSPADPFDSIGPQMIGLIQSSGMVGLGGAAFPSHVKVSVPKGKKVNFIILNGCECEPVLTCDHRVMVEQAPQVVRGLRILMKHVDAKRGYIGIESNKPDAIEILKKECGSESDIEVVPLQVKYPQGAEKMLIDAILKKEVPAGGLPLDLEIVVNNVATSAAISNYFDTGMPLIERAVTISGSCVKSPKNLIVPLGTPIRQVLEFCDTDFNNLQQVILGGPMMGMAQKDLDIPVIKGTSGILAFDKPLSPIQEEQACIRCGRCLNACPMFLNPSTLHFLVRNGRAEELVEHHMADCFECGSCSFTCPSNIPLAQLMRVGKAMLRT
jgi:electron transport complex protein RnfC